MGFRPVGSCLNTVGKCLFLIGVMTDLTDFKQEVDGVTRAWSGLAAFL